MAAAAVVAVGISPSSDSSDWGQTRVVVVVVGGAAAGQALAEQYMTEEVKVSKRDWGKNPKTDKRTETTKMTAYLESSAWREGSAWCRHDPPEQEQGLQWTNGDSTNRRWTSSRHCYAR